MFQKVTSEADGISACRSTSFHAIRRLWRRVDL